MRERLRARWRRETGTERLRPEGRGRGWPRAPNSDKVHDHALRDLEGVIHAVPVRHDRVVTHLAVR